MPAPEVITYHDVSAKDMDRVLEWIDSIELSRPKKNLARDFSDGVLLAELLKASFPKLVELHNYPTSSKADQKKVNWSFLNRQVLVRLNLKVADAMIQQIVDAKAGAIESVLWAIRKSILEQPKPQLEFYSVIRARTPAPASTYHPKIRTNLPQGMLPPRNRPVSSVGPAPPAAPTPQQEYMAEEFKRSRAPAARTKPEGQKEKTYLGMAPPISAASQGGNVSIPVDGNNNSILEEIPKILYRGQEMVDYNLAVELAKRNSDLLMSQEEMARKVARHEKLIEMKEKRIEELSMQYQQEKRKNMGATGSDHSVGEDYQTPTWSPMSSIGSLPPTGGALSPTSSMKLSQKPSGDGFVPSAALSPSIKSPSPKTSRLLLPPQAASGSERVVIEGPKAAAIAPPRRAYVDV